MNRTASQQLELLLVLRLCGTVFNEHWEHLMTFQDAFPVIPQHQNTAQKARAMQLMEDAVAETTLLAREAGPGERSLVGVTQLLASTIEANCGLAGIGIAISKMNDQVVASPGVQSVIKRTLDLFKEHGHATALSDPRAIKQSNKLLEFVQAQGLFVN